MLDNTLINVKKYERERAGEKRGEKKASEHLKKSILYIILFVSQGWEGALTYKHRLIFTRVELQLEAC